MANQPYSRFTYTQEELDLNKVIAHTQGEIEELRKDNEQERLLLTRAIAKAESLTRQKRITEKRLAPFKPKTERRGVVETGRSWSDLVDEANAAIPGYVTIEDICSAQEFEDAFRYLDEIDNEFKEKTGLTKADLAFVVIAIALQCARQYVLQPLLDAHRLTHKQNDAVVKKVIPKRWQEILCGSVPYDAIEKIDKASDPTGLSGRTHRYRTLGHDPLLGWLFGPLSILSDTLTTSDFVTSYEVKDMKIGSAILTTEAFDRALEQAKVRFNLPVSVIRQGIHFGSDYFSKQGLPIPVISSVNNDVSKFLLQNNINMLNVTEGIVLSSIVNTIVSCAHGLFNTEHIAPELYEVRTRKILSISNAIASSGNVAWVAITKNAKLLDLGGLLVTIQALCSNARFIARAKQEFIEGKLNKEWAQISEEIDRMCAG